MIGYVLTYLISGEFAGAGYITDLAFR